MEYHAMLGGFEGGWWSWSWVGVLARCDLAHLHFADVSPFNAVSLLLVMRTLWINWKRNIGL
jgi:hypothetical protein